MRTHLSRAPRNKIVAVCAGLGALFLLHPANVEASAWISQTKTTLALALSLGALLLFPSRPGLSLVTFTLGLLTKASAAFALPMAAVFVWLDRDARGPWRARRYRFLPNTARRSDCRRCAS